MIGTDESRERDRPAADLAVRDDLTGLFNRRLLSELFAQRWRQLLDEHGRLSLVMIDLDGFKEVNDNFGHMCGDAVLRATAGVLRRGFRGDDLVVRYGGDEFVVLLPGVGSADAARLGERVRQAMSGLGEDPEVVAAGVDVPVSFSIGVASAPEDGDEPETILARADERLFIDKRRRHPLSGQRVRVLAVAGLLAGGTVAAFLLGRGVEPVPVPAAPAAAAPSAESPGVEALLAEIEQLREQLGARRESHAVSPDAEQDRLAIEALQSQIRGLEARLQAERARTAPAAGSPAQEVTDTPGRSPALPVARVQPIPTPTATRPAAPAAEQPAPAAEQAAAPAVAVLPVLLHYDRPRYPEIARRMHREADVELKVVVDERGRVVSVGRVGPATGYGFDEAARDAAFGARFTPGTVGGVPVTMETLLTIRFRLDEPR